MNRNSLHEIRMMNLIFHSLSPKCIFGCGAHEVCKDIEFQSFTCTKKCEIDNYEPK